jgi:Tol biopolymer transport system component
MTRDTARLAFTVSCTSMTGVIEIALKASGFDYGDAFSVAIGSSAPREITPNSITRVAVTVGEHAVKLAQIPETCTVSGSDSTLLAIATSAVKRDTARAGFQLACTGAELIAFSRGSDIFLVRPDGSKAKQLTNGIDPAWSADGARLAFVRSFCEEYYYCESGLAVFDYRSIAGSVSWLTSEFDSSPAWSPNGATVVFVRNGALFQVKPDGTGLARIPTPSATFVTSGVAWSPNGARLAFGCGQSEDFDDICIINEDGSGFARLTAQGRSNSDPAWSPDGTQIAFVRVDYQAQRDSRPQPYVALMQSDGSSVRRLASGTSPAWSRDGRRIVFTNSVQPGLATIKPDGTALTQITTNRDDDAPSWRP